MSETPFDLFGGYTSPIMLDVWYEVKKVEAERDKALRESLKATLVTKYNFDVDIDELMKALQYERDQYALGFNDGYEKGLADGITEGAKKILAAARIELEGAEDEEETT